MLNKEEIKALPTWCDRLRETALPVYIYGMGSGCEKVLELFGQKGISCSGIIVSDDHVSDKLFHGFRLRALSEAENSGEDFSVACGFGTDIPELMARIEALAARHTLVFPDTAVAGGGSFEKDKLLERYDDMMRVYSLLCDEVSRRVFYNVIRFKISGDISYLKEYTDPDEPFESILNLGMDEIYCNLGAYDGDTVAEFLAHTGGCYRQIYAVEPARKNFAKLLRSCQQFERITLINAAVSDRDGIGHFSTGAGRQQAVTQSGTPVSLRSLDSILAGGECSYIKYDVEGEDAKALLGSRETIVRYSPKIRTGIYHRPYDIIDIPLLLHGIKPDYKFYMRRRRYYPAWDTELFAVP